jgi:hypothetical protein
MLPIISYNDHDHRADSSAMMKFSRNSQKICTTAVRVFAMESGARQWKHRGGHSAGPMSVNLGQTAVVEAMGPGGGAREMP